MDTARSAPRQHVPSQPVTPGEYWGRLHAQRRVGTAACWRHTSASTGFWQLFCCLNRHSTLK